MKSINLNGIWTLGICTQEEYKALHANFCTLQQLKTAVSVCYLAMFRETMKSILKKTE